LLACLDFLLEDKSPMSRLLAVVFSGGGGHVYYRIPAITDFKNWRMVYESALKKLEKLTSWKADLACKNPGRIMRLPGSFSAKRGIQTEILYLNPEAQPIFTVEDYLKFKAKPQKIIKNLNTKSDLRIELKNLNGGEIRKLPNRKMLELLSGTNLVNNEVFTFRYRASGGEYIDINDKPANCWLDEKGMIGSGDKAGPTWVEWLSYYGHAEREAYVFLQEQGITQVH